MSPLRVIIIVGAIAAVALLVAFHPWTPASGSYRIVGANWEIVYSNISANGTVHYWLGQSYVNSCANCPVVLSAARSSLF